ncbi:serine/threonine-protein kinase [Sphaerospermopsis sp. LEGE 08334]|uniref:serine/threonine-protein kinase n=1 Tax=Sphaerospermopsis sp. LEGE 08334 TaxID=1828651 RepID=UPI00187E0C31|nr:serine/threonine-protein kinase [Sphaerospermopsis sp. LEGE 08334]MBE9057507.1 serine/threonine protein kinase [Sphaerospermopsis sp. LEGE 08334]
MKQICCLNPDCDNPLQPDTEKFCFNCGVPLVILRSRYRPIKPLGGGGFAKTYLAEDIDKLEENCVIKQLAPQTQSSYALKKAQELFEQEAKQLQKIEHLQIPKLKAYFEERGYLYLIQDFIDGEDLLIELTNQGKFNDKKIKALLLELLPVLIIVHNQNIIHRDIKPENIMRRYSDGKLFLIDFGASKQIHGTLQSSTRIGTFGYAAVEQMDDGEVYPASDLFSLGATCFHLLTDVHPWHLWKNQGYAWVNNWRDHVQQSVSVELGEILDNLLKFNYEDRYQSAQEVLKVLQSSIQSPSFQPPNSKISNFPQSNQQLAFSRRSLIQTVGLLICVFSLIIIGQNILMNKNNKPVTENPPILDNIRTLSKDNKLNPENSLKPNNIISLRKVKISSVEVTTSPLYSIINLLTEMIIYIFKIAFRITWESIIFTWKITLAFWEILLRIFSLIISFLKIW